MIGQLKKKAQNDISEGKCQNLTCIEFDKKRFVLAQDIIQDLKLRPYRRPRDFVLAFWNLAKTTPDDLVYFHQNKNHPTLIVFLAVEFGIASVNNYNCSSNQYLASSLVFWTLIKPETKRCINLRFL